MLVPGVQREGEETTFLPLEMVFSLPFIPYAGASAPFEDIDQVFVKMLLGLELTSGRDLANIGCVHVPRAVQLDHNTAATSALPGLERLGIDVFYDGTPNQV